jgi:hypothetical protein
VRIKNRGTQNANNVRVRGFHCAAPLGTIWPNDFQPLTTAELLVGTLAANNAEEKIVGPFTWTPVGSEPGQDSLLMIVSATEDESNIIHFTGADLIPEWRLVPHDNNIGLRRVTSVNPVVNNNEQSAARVTAGGVATGNAETIAAQLLQTLGLSGTPPQHVYIKGLTIQVDFENSPRGGAREIAVPAGEMAPMMAADASAGAQWGMRRHAAIATAAMERLQSDRARNEIVRILDNGGDASLGEAARWADRLRGGDRPSDPATDRFLGEQRNRAHNTWHYVNLPLDLDGYDRQQHPEFTRERVLRRLLRYAGSHI